MRLNVISGVALAAIAVLGASLSAGESSPGSSPPINRVDPVSGASINGDNITCIVRMPQPVTLTESGPSRPGQSGEVIIAFSNRANCDLVQRSDATTQQLYATAAQTNRMVRDGRLADAPGTGTAPGTGGDADGSSAVPRLGTPVQPAPALPAGQSGTPAPRK